MEISALIHPDLQIEIEAIAGLTIPTGVTPIFNPIFTRILADGQKDYFCAWPCAKTIER